MKTNNKFLYKLTDRLGTLVVVPLGENNFTLEYNREDEDKLSYKKQLSGKITFKDEAFKRILQMENSIYRCDEQTLTIIKVCNNVERIYFVGKISLNEAEFDLDKCKVVMKYAEDKTDKCVDDGKNNKLNLLQLISSKIVVKTASYAGTIEFKTCNHGDNAPIDANYWCGTGDPYSQRWTIIQWNNYSPGGSHHRIQNKWAREIFEVDCSETPDPNWVLIEDNCGTTGKKKFAGGITTFGCVFTTVPEDEMGAYSYTMDCKILGYDNGTATIDNGVHLTDVLKELIRASCPNLTLKSDFFQINPDNVSANNYVTGRKSTTDNIVIFQKSDVKRPTATGNASKLEISLETMLDVLRKMFNVKWRIEGNVFRIEHVSKYSKNIGIDVTSNQLKKYFMGYRQYSYESSQIPQKETWKFKEQKSADWTMEITYSGCVSNGKKNEVSNLIDDAMTDIVFAMQNPEADSKFVEDAGFVLISTKKVGSEYFINTENLGGGRTLNNVLSWKALIRDFHYYERPMKVGKVNGVTTEFITTIPTKKGVRFAIPYNFCEFTFNPDNYVKTLLGNGVVDSAKHRFKDYFLELELLYESNQNLVPNAPPTLSGGGTFNTYQNTPIVIDVVANDPDGVVTGLVINNPPYNGTIIFLSISQFQYVPNDGFVGTDYFSIKAVDNFSEVSNSETFIIKVKPPNQPPKANDDTFTVYNDNIFNQGTSILANDSDDNGFSLVTTNTTTVQGVPITISPSGFFNYTPPNGFEGQDSFQYTIKDDGGLTSTATVYLNVIDRHKPVAVDDNYQTLFNVGFSTDGTTGREKLTANDYTPNGQSYNYTTTPETKATTQGGTVQIFGDGNFNYTPPNGFIGVDSFEYTVHNPNGSRIGTARISLTPMIYVKLIYSDQKRVGHPSQAQYSKTHDITVYFFSDAGGITPFDVSGLNFRVKLKNHVWGENNDAPFDYTNFYMTSIMSGTSVKLFDDFTYFSRQNGDGYNEEYNNEMKLEAFNYTIIT